MTNCSPKVSATAICNSAPVPTVASQWGFAPLSTMRSEAIPLWNWRGYNAPHAGRVGLELRALTSGSPTRTASH